MTGSDYAVLAFLLGALFFAPTSRLSVALLASAAIAIGAVGLLLGDMELALTAGTVPSALGLAFFSASVSVYKYRFLPGLRAWFQGDEQRSYPDAFRFAFDTLPLPYK